MEAKPMGGLKRTYLVAETWMPQGIRGENYACAIVLKTKNFKNQLTKGNGKNGLGSFFGYSNLRQDSLIEHKFYQRNFYFKILSNGLSLHSRFKSHKLYENSTKSI